MAHARVQFFFFFFESEMHDFRVDLICLIQTLITDTNFKTSMASQAYKTTKLDGCLGTGLKLSPHPPKKHEVPPSFSFFE
jgi:hypothetical protein